jgi:hypothetical protein
MTIQTRIDNLINTLSELLTEAQAIKAALIAQQAAIDSAQQQPVPWRLELPSAASSGEKQYEGGYDASDTWLQTNGYAGAAWVPGHPLKVELWAAEKPADLVLTYRIYSSESLSSGDPQTETVAWTRA